MQHLDFGKLAISTTNLVGLRGSDLLSSWQKLKQLCQERSGNGCGGTASTETHSAQRGAHFSSHRGLGVFENQSSKPFFEFGTGKQTLLGFITRVHPRHQQRHRKVHNLNKHAPIS
jgi:hypothetical protein